MGARKLADPVLESNHSVPVLEAKGLTRYYLGKTAISNVNLAIHAGELAIVVGINGAGKSTLIRALSGIEEVDEGYAQLFGMHYRDISQSFRDQLFVITEDFAIDAPYSVVAFFEQLGGFYPGYSHEEFHRIAELFNLDVSKRFLDYSRGQKVQLQLCFAFAIGAKMLFLDEVTAVLDLATRNTLRNLIKEFKADGGTIVAATNIINDLNDISDRIVFLNRGRALFECGINEVSENVVRVELKTDTALDAIDEFATILRKRNADGSTTAIIQKSALAVIPNDLIVRSTQIDSIEEIFSFEKELR